MEFTPGQHTMLSPSSHGHSVNLFSQDGNKVDSVDDERPRKRARSESPIAVTDTVESVKHDPVYYFEDGSTVLLVQNVLFKVHKTILSKDSSTFETMFRLPSGEGIAAEGGRDGDPVVLQGDTPDQFRSLLWALYAMPHEIAQAGPAQGGLWQEFDRFCDLTLMVHKYCFKSLETWALGTFLHWLSPSSRHTPPRIHSTAAQSLLCSCSEIDLLDRLRRVLELAVLCDHQSLRAAVVQRLQDELRSPDADLPWFVALGERFNIAPLMGAAYYALMVQGRDKWIGLAAAGHLTRGQLGKLHNGYYALVSQWEALRVSPPLVQPCLHYGHCCKQRWSAYWKELTKDDSILGKFPADVVGRLECVQSRVYTCTGIMDMHQECRSKALAAVRSLIRETREGLATHFVDLP